VEVLPFNLVRKERLELSHLAALEPKSSASTNSATSANINPASWLKTAAQNHLKVLIIFDFFRAANNQSGVLTRAQILPQRRYCFNYQNGRTTSHIAGFSFGHARPNETETTPVP
jgi:hypothetical protein